MSRSKQKTKQKSEHPPAPGGHNARGGGSVFERARHGFLDWYQAKNPVLRFVVGFGLMMVLYYCATLTVPFKHHFFPAYLRFNAQLANTILNWIGQHTVVNGTSVFSSLFAIDVRRGCDAVEPSALFISAVIAFPGPLVKKFPGLLIGTFVLLTVNLIRIVSLFLFGVYSPGLFHLMHADVWQVLFILLAVVFWALWIQWATRRSPPAPHVPA